MYFILDPRIYHEIKQILGLEMTYMMLKNVTNNVYQR